MNDEYLWQKTGADPEVEKLEKTLAVFRYRETPLPVPVVELSKSRTPRWRISLAFAFAASVIAAVLIAAVFLGRVDQNDDAVVFVASPDLEIPSAPAPAAIDEKKVTPAPASKIVPQFARNQRTKPVRTERVIDRRPKTNDPRPNAIAVLTEEEKYAYRQLMLALSISSSKFKIVRDTINGNENIEGTNSTNQR